MYNAVFQEEERKKRLRERARKLISETRDSIGKPETEFIRKISAEGTMSKNLPLSASQQSAASVDTG